jgi:hypothetical protein
MLQRIEEWNMALWSHVLRALAAVALLSVLTGSCGGSGGDVTDPTDPGPGPWAFRASLIDPALIQKIKPLGNMSPNGHWLPTDHIYFQVADPDLGQSPVARRTAFFAPADGIVTDVFTSPTTPDVGLRIRVTTTIFYTLGHVIPGIPLTRGTRITAGQRLGTTGSVFSIDLGLFDDGKTLTGFVNPVRVGNSANTDAPLRYFDEPLRSQLYAKVERIGPDFDGRIDYDVPGRLSGNWFLTDASSLTFAYDTYDPARVVISVSGGLSQTGIFSIAAADPLPRDVSVASGVVRYTLAGWGETGKPQHIRSGIPTARMLVQMLDDQRIRVELFPVSATATAFTGSAREFVR